MSTNTKSGKADQGSRLYLQEYMAHAQDELSELYTRRKKQNYFSKLEKMPY